MVAIRNGVMAACGGSEKAAKWHEKVAWHDIGSGVARREGKISVMKNIVINISNEIMKNRMAAK